MHLLQRLLRTLQNNCFQVVTFLRNSFILCLIKAAAAMAWLLTF